MGVAIECKMSGVAECKTSGREMLANFIGERRGMGLFHKVVDIFTGNFPDLLIYVVATYDIFFLEVLYDKFSLS